MLGRSQVKLAVTLGRHIGAPHQRRAAALAARFSCPLLQRRGLEGLAAQHEVDAFYVVSVEHEGIRLPRGAVTFVQPGMIKTKVGEGRRHPLIRAVAGDFDDDEREGAPVESVLDGTLGLAGDALHVATVLDVDVHGSEGSTVMHALLEEGLPRLANDPLTAAARRITLPEQATDTLTLLRALPDDSVDVVMLDPMMRRPLKSAPTFDLVRFYAVSTPATPALLLEARRVARRRVVLKLARGIALPADHPFAFGRTTFGVHVSYRVHRKGVDIVMQDRS